MYSGLSIIANAKRYDPTRTTGLRNRFVADCNRRFNELNNVVWKSIVDEDCFGLKESQMMNVLQLKSTGNRAFSFVRSQDKVKAFMEWLRTQQATGILEIRNVNQWGTAIDEAWSNLYVYDSYKRGVIRARYELKKAGYDIPPMEGMENIYATLNNPFHADRLGLLYSRVYSDLQGITEGMDTLISRVLTQGLADGDNPIPIARKLRAVMTGQGMGDLGITDSLGRFIPAKRRAEMLARTEIIRAHAEASLQEFENWAVEGVDVEMEWAASGDACSLCLEMAAGGPYTIQQARGLIPYHPNCRCAWLPKRKQAESSNLTSSEKADIINYSNADSSGINFSLRKGKELDSDMKRQIDNIESGLKKAKKFNGTTYRGMKFSSEKDYLDFLKNVEEGNYFVDKGFLSTSKSEQVAGRFYNDPLGTAKKKVRLEIEAKGNSGVDLESLNLGVKKSEQEVLFNRNSKFRIKSRNIIQELNKYGEEIMVELIKLQEL